MNNTKDSHQIGIPEQYRETAVALYDEEMKPFDSDEPKKQKGQKRGVCASLRQAQDKPNRLSRTASLRQAQDKPSPLSRTALIEKMRPEGRIFYYLNSLK